MSWEKKNRLDKPQRFLAGHPVLTLCRQTLVTSPSCHCRHTDWCFISPMSVPMSFSNRLFYEMNILMESETNFYVANNLYEASRLP